MILSMCPQRSVFARGLCWSLSYLLLFTWCALPYAQDPSPTQAAADRLERCFRAIEGIGRELPRETFDPKAVLEQVGREPDALFHWVRDQTFWVPYRGALRGAVGVLMDRLGNSLDRSLLLGELLRLSGRHVRLGHATVPEPLANELLAKVRPVPAGRLRKPPPLKDPSGEDLFTKYAAAYDLDVAELRQNTQQVALEVTRATEDAAKRMADQAPKIAGALSALAPPAAQGTDVGDAARKSAALDLADHWWVQFQDGDRWVDLDALLPDAEPGTALAPASETFPLDTSEGGKIPLDSRFCHEVQIRVVVERWEAGRLQEQPVLTQVLRPAELYGQRITLNHFPLDWPADFNLIEAPDPTGALRAAALQQHEWLPVLTIGGTQFYGGSFSDGGRVNDKPSLGALTGTTKAAGGVMGSAFDALSAEPPAPVGPAPVAPVGPEGVLTAEWMEYEIHVPGQPAEKIRRELFDLLGPAARSAGPAAAAAPALTEAQRLDRSLAPLGSLEVLPLTGQVSSRFVLDLGVRRIAANREPLTNLFRDAETADSKTMLDRLEKVTPLPGQLYALALMRHAWNPAGDEIYLDRPNILTYRQQLRADAQGGIRAEEGFDIVANAVAVRAGAGADPFILRLGQGVADSNAEAVLMMAAAGGAVGGPPASGAADVFAAAQQSGSPPWVLVRSAKDAAWQNLRLPPDVRARIESDLAAGYAVLVPPEPVAVAGRTASAWWRVDPSTGHALGMNDEGWGASMVEYAFLLMRVSIAAYGSYVCVQTVRGSTTHSTGQKRAGYASCLAAGILVGFGFAYAAFLEGGMTVGVGATAGHLGGLLGALGTYLARGGFSGKK